MAELLDEIHPGEILLEDFMKPMGISARQLAADIDVSPSRISDLVNGNRPITADTALRLGLFFNMAPRFWMNLQTEYDMRVAARTLTDKIAPRIRVFKRLRWRDKKPRRGTPAVSYNPHARCSAPADSVDFHGLPDAGLLVRTLRTMVSASMATTTPKDMPTGIL